MNKALLFAAGFALLASPVFGQGSSRPADAVDRLSAPYDPTIDPADFTHVIANKYYTLKPGMRAGYEKTGPEGTTHVEMEVTGETREVMGITTLVVRNREWLNGQLTGSSRDWVAQDSKGTVWNFGEAVEHYQDGKLIDRDGSWEAGVDGAKPGILMLGSPKVGDTYRQEYYPGKAEDMGTVVAIGEFTLPGGAHFQDCLQVRDWNRGKDEGGIESKYYCVGVGLAVLEEKDGELLELVAFSTRNPMRARPPIPTFAGRSDDRNSTR